MSPSLIANNFKRLSLLYFNSGYVLALLTGVHCTAKWELRSSYFILKIRYNFAISEDRWYDWYFFVVVQKSTYDGLIPFWSCIEVK